MRRWRAIGICALFPLVATGPAAAQAGQYAVTATGVCAPTQASYEAQLKRRPLGILNEGPGFVLITCSLPVNTSADYRWNPRPGYGYQVNTVDITFTPFFSNYAFPKTVTCNLIAGSRELWQTQTNKVSLGQDSPTLTMDFDFLDRLSMRGSYSVLCQLPAGVEIGTILYKYGDLDGPP